MKTFIAMLVLSVMFTSALAQGEVCNNGVDDDGDGFIDCYDRACSISTFCKDFFLGEVAECYAEPPAFPEFSMTLDYSSPNKTATHLGRVVVGDVDGDGKPEMLTTNKFTSKLYIISAAERRVKDSIALPAQPGWEDILIANVDPANGPCAEIVVVDVNWNIYMYNACTKAKIWGPVKLLSDCGMMGFADFNGDGNVELYARDAVFNAATGAVIVPTKATTGDEWKNINGGPVAVDIIDDEDLELVVGCKIYTIDIAAGTSTLARERTEYFVRQESSSTSIADYNLDGHLDVLASGSTEKHGKNTTVFYWDVKNDVLKTYIDKISGTFKVYDCNKRENSGGFSEGSFYANGWKNGTGRLNIGDLDGDGNLNVSYVSGKYLYALDENLNTFWRKEVNEETSGNTGCTLFDFNGDGKSEIVYRDEKFIYIINGTDGTLYDSATRACVSRTNREYPIVADVDADGQTEICVTCGTNDALSIANFCTLEYSVNSHVRVFKTGNDDDPWVPARRVWNQHGYFNVNINDDLTVPARQQKHHIQFSNGSSCSTRPLRPLNNFLNQSPFLNMDGCPDWKTPDLAFVENSLSVDPPTCPKEDFTVSFQFKNAGDNSLSGDLPITFYSGNPLAANAIKLNTITITLAGFSVDAVHTVNDATVNGLGNPFTLYIVLNDDGSTVPTPISLPNTGFLECDYGNNVISSPVTPLPVDLSAEKIQDNIKCLTGTSPSNGAARAWVADPAAASKNTTDYNFYWTVASPPAPQGAVINSLAQGSYKVYALHKTANCSSDTATVAINQTDRDVDVKIIQLAAVTNCVTENGSLKAIVNDTNDDDIGEPAANFNFSWHEGPGFTDPKVSITDVAIGLKATPAIYTVIVQDKSTGCESSASASVTKNLTIPVVATTSTNIQCSDANSGSASATVNSGTNGFTFDWFNGSTVKPTADFQGSTYSNRAAGFYTVVATDNTSKCKSAAKTQEITKTAPIVVTVTDTDNQTSCDPARPNGAATASAGASGFTYEWFKGQNTKASNRIATTATVTGLAAGVYTVKATSTQGCTDTHQVTITNNIQTPVLALAGVSDLTDCRTPNGTITVNVSLDSPADYDFFWYRGSFTKTTPDFTDRDNVLEGLDIGTYTVKAVHKTKFCNASPITAEVEDNTPTILIEQNADVTLLPTSCNDLNGQMEVFVSAPGNTLGFTIEWFKNASADPFATDNGVTASLQSGLGSASYTIRATNMNNGCTALDTFPLPFAGAHILSLIGTTNPSRCNPDNDGGLEVNLIPTPTQFDGPPPISFSVNDYIVNFYSGVDDTAPLVASVDGSTGTLTGDANGSANFALSNLSPGFYTIVAIEDHLQLSSCKSVPITVEITKYNTPPIVTLTATPTNNVNCSSASATGEIAVEIREASDAAGSGPRDPAGYNIVWSPNSADNGVVASNLMGGTYAVYAINTNTNCSSDTVEIDLYDAIPPIVITEDADLMITDVTICSRPNGASATVVSVNGEPLATPAEYTFAWFDANFNPWPDATTPATSASVIDLSEGTYFLQATKIGGTEGIGCQSEPVEFFIEDLTSGTVQYNLEAFVNPTRCKQPANELGELVVTQQSHFAYEWYTGTTASGAVVSTTNEINNIAIPNGSTEADYTVVVTNTNNDCSITTTYTLQLDVIPVVLAASGSPLTSCFAPNGSLFGTTTGVNTFNYTYSWYNGTSPKAVADYPLGKQVDDLSFGDYTLVAVDNADAFCVSEPAVVTIEDGRVYPVVEAEALAPLTICAPTRADGSASADVNGDVVNYHFDWYASAPPTGISFFRGSEAGGLSDITYSVIASNILSGCSDTTQVTIENDILPIPVPEVELISNVTACDANNESAANGILGASVDGNTSGYIFHWYNTDPGPQPDTATFASIGEIYSKLDVGTYYVSATSRATGCISGPANGSIIFVPELPDFDFRVTNATCKIFEEGESNGAPDGAVSIGLLTNVEILTIEWDAYGKKVYGPMLTNVEAGSYSVTVTTIMGCHTTKTVDVKPDINPFNGISRNGDSKNETFYINCIENFPDNHVKIYNRAGTLVYEAEGYDNSTVLFDGKSNKGLSVMGTDLPDGTYFYIIDKRDGTKPMAGYLEIVK